MEFRGKGAMTDRDLLVVVDPKHQSGTGRTAWLAAYINLESDAEAAKTTTKHQLAIRDSVKKDKTPDIDPKTNKPYKDFTTPYSGNQLQLMVDATGATLQRDEETGKITGLEIPEGCDTAVYDPKRGTYTLSVVASVMPDKNGHDCYLINTRKPITAGPTITEETLGKTFNIARDNRSARNAAKAAQKQQSAEAQTETQVQAEGQGEEMEPPL